MREVLRLPRISCFMNHAIESMLDIMINIIEVQPLKHNVLFKVSIKMSNIPVWCTVDCIAAVIVHFEIIHFKIVVHEVTSSLHCKRLVCVESTNVTKFAKRHTEFGPF